MFAIGGVTLMPRLSVRARAVDLLGRQQVAGVPTAISELFKNAHDAYARDVVVDFYRQQNLFVLRDNGVGMSRKDFEQRWLTIGTESKTGSGSLAPPPDDPSMPRRPSLGEKGIGRLAVALIGERILILTRPKRDDNELGELTAAFIDWRLFTIPGATLADIDIPVETYAGGTFPLRENIAKMVAAVQCNAVELCDRLNCELPTGMDVFPFDPESQLDVLPAAVDIEHPLDVRTGPGTQFWISPVNDVLEQDIDAEKGRTGAAGGAATPLQKFLLGFSNSMVPDARPPITVAFRDHADGVYTDRISEEEFFTPREFESADHRIEGRFDEYGQFEGTVGIYGLEEQPFTLHWPDARGKATRCGPFDIRFAYVQGNARESRLPKDEFDAIGAKLNRIGGMYVYRNGIRVLPYGDSEFDYLNIEQRRNRGAGYYFFSYRRIFGYLQIDAEQNAALVEKAGREGFQENIAYRQFRNILENFFVQTAATFFRDKDDDGVFPVEKARMEREAKLLEHRRQQVAGRRKQFGNDLDAFFAELAANSFHERCNELVAAFEAFAAQSDDVVANADIRVRSKEIRRDIEEVRRATVVRRPRGVGLTRELSRSWARYEIEHAKLRENLFNLVSRRVEEVAADLANRIEIAPRLLVEDALTSVRDREEKRTRSLSADIRRDAERMHRRASELARGGLLNVQQTIETALADFERRSGDSADLPALQAEIEERITAVAQERAQAFERMRDAIRSVVDETNDVDTVAAMEGELEERRERDLESLQLAQMGLALGIVHHEFAGVVTSVRRNVRRLKNWADRNPKLRELYDDIARSYGHLDGYLALFAPLNRRLARAPTLIAGAEVEDYLRSLLGERMRRHNVQLIVTDQFREVHLQDLVATIYPAFVNIVDNAVFWSARDLGGIGETGSGTVELDFVGDRFIVTDNGPGVSSADREAVFEAGFSRKPGGTGLGLYVTRTLMERAGYSVTFVEPVADLGACLEITVPTKALNADAAQNEVEAD